MSTNHGARLKAYHNSQLIFQIILKIDKDTSSFLYFILEGVDNLCFYSTLEHKVGDPFRLIEINCPIELKDQLNQLLNHFRQNHPIEIISQLEIEDS